MLKNSFSRSLVTMAAVGLLLATGCITRNAVAGDHCFYKGTMFSDGAAACQSGTQYRCNDGNWKSLSVACTDTPRPSRSCDYDGISFSTGSASCQAGSQFRCEDGSWRSLGMPCTVGDSPIRVVPSGRTCMYEGATVSNGSTICRSSSTFLCSDGEWVNLGTACR